jgi:hypothetical protein
MASEIDAEKLAAFEALLRKDLERRTIERGDAIHVPFPAVVVSPGEDADALIEEEKARLTAKLRKAGETREIVFDEPMVIITGVPRSPDFEKDWPPLPPAKPYDRYASPEPRKPAITQPSEEPAEPLVAHRIYAQVAPPTETDPGAIVEGSYTLTEDGVLRVFDTDRNLLGTERLPPAPTPVQPPDRSCAQRRPQPRSTLRFPHAACTTNAVQGPRPPPRLSASIYGRTTSCAWRAERLSCLAQAVR